jgi:DNA-binding protein HU-beta
MNKAEFIEKLAGKLNTTKVEANKNLETILQCIAETMKEEDLLKFVGFGTFKAKQTEEKQVRTPKGTMATVPAGRRVSFSVGKEFKDIVNGR